MGGCFLLFVTIMHLICNIRWRFVNQHGGDINTKKFKKIIRRGKIKISLHSYNQTCTEITFRQSQKTTGSLDQSFNFNSGKNEKTNKQTNKQKKKNIISIIETRNARYNTGIGAGTVNFLSYWYC